jgi:hypothetical protein
MKKTKDAKGTKMAKVKDLPTRSLKGKDAAAVKGGMTKTDLTMLKINNTLGQVTQRMETDASFLKVSQ